MTDNRMAEIRREWNELRAADERASKQMTLLVGARADREARRKELEREVEALRAGYADGLYRDASGRIELPLGGMPRREERRRDGVELEF